MFKTLDTEVTMTQLSAAAQTGRPVYVNYRAGIGTYTTEDLTQIVRMMQVLKIRSTTVMLSSKGGLVLRGIELHNFLRNMPLDISMHNAGTMDSIANTIFLAAEPEKRSAEPNSRFFFHGITRGFDGGATEVMLRDALESVRRDQDAIAHTIAERTSLTVKEVKRAFNRETIWTPEQAKERGIIHEVKLLPIPSNAEVINIFDPPPKHDDA